MAITETEIGSRDRASFVCDTAPGLLTIRIRGEIDHHTAVRIRKDIDVLLYERRPQKLILDLSAVSFMDSSGLGLIMGRYAVVRELAGDLVVFNPSREIRGILRLAGMERMVKIEYPRFAPHEAPRSRPAASHSGQARRKKAASVDTACAASAQIRKEKDA